jgi:uncharacterized CHY-type Zn-finger protein
MNAMDNFKDEMSLNLFGRSRTLAIAGAQCVACGRPATEFRNELSRKEFGISGLCQHCQDRFFDEPMEDEG